MDKRIRELLKEAHDHGFCHNIQSLGWTMEKSFVEFCKQNNIPLITSEEVKEQEAQKAQDLLSKGHSLRNIASLLGYNHPESIRKLIKLHHPSNKQPNQQ